MGSAKEQMIHIIHNQPDDSSYDEILNELAFCLMIEQGLAVPVSTTTCPSPSTGRLLIHLRETTTEIKQNYSIYNININYLR